jgi:hypothetical protein
MLRVYQNFEAPTRDTLRLLDFHFSPNGTGEKVKVKPSGKTDPSLNLPFLAKNGPKGQVKVKILFH